MDALDALELDVARRGRPADPRLWAGRVEARDGLRDRADDLVDVDDADVQVGQQAERATTLVGPGIEDDRARLGDGDGAAGDDAVERVEVGMRQDGVVGRRAPRSIPRATLSGIPAGTAIRVAPCAASTAAMAAGRSTAVVRWTVAR